MHGRSALGQKYAASLLWHVGYGPAHYDLIIGSSQACMTFGLEPDGQHWRWQQKSLHRRRYLHYSGPVSGGRGRVSQIWHGAARLFKRSTGYHIQLPEFMTIDLVSHPLAGQCARFTMP